MKHYRDFFDRQEISPQSHQALLDLEEGPRRRAPKGGAHVMRYTALAACCALVVGLGGRWLFSGAGVEPEVSPAPAESQIGDEAPVPPEESMAPDVGETGGFVAAGPGDGSKLMFPMIAGVDYADVTGEPEVAASIALPQGAFTVELTKEDIQALFWGPEGKPAVEHVKADPGDFPALLMNWAGYSITGEAIYDGNGDLWELRVRGEKGEDSFALRCAPGGIPATCVVERGAAATDVLGVEVSGWYRSYDNDGDDVVEHVCTSEFIAHDVGFRFTNVGSGGMRAGTDEATDLGGAKAFNQMVVTQLCHADGFYLDQFAHCDDVPDWAEESFDTLSQVQGHTCYGGFAHYLPAEGPEGYGEFHGRYSYQEGVKDCLFVRWTRGYDDVEVEVDLPGGERTFPPAVDIGVPESYDWRLYDGSISDSVPEAYRANFYKTAFRASDMSLEVIRARMNDKDTGGQSCRFWVLHSNGVVVGYDCSGVSAEYVWSLVEPTVPATVSLGTVTFDPWSLEEPTLPPGSITHHPDEHHTGAVTTAAPVVTHHPDVHHDAAVPTEICSLPVVTHHPDVHHGTVVPSAAPVPSAVSGHHPDRHHG